MKYQTYPAYKDSGVEWLGEVPEHWEIKRLKFLCKVQTGDKDTVNAIEDGKYPFFVRSQTVEHINSFTFDCEAVLTAGDGVGVGKVFHYVNGKFDFHQRVYMMNNFSNVTGIFFFHYLATLFHKVALDGGAKSTVDSLRMPLFMNFQISVPLLSEQQKIAQFLDHETAKIDTLIEKQQRLIELLKEKRQAVISHAVTKGLNPNAPMKDSGVAWLGDVPEGWEVSRIGFYANKIGSGKTPRGGSEIYQDEGILFLRSQNVYDDGLKINQNECVYISDEIHEEMKNTSVKTGDVLLNITGGSIGRTCLVYEEIEANVNQHVCILRFPKNINEYLSYVMKADVIKYQIESCQTGGNREGLNFEQIAKLVVSIPPECDRLEILKHIKLSIKKYDELVDKANRAIELMQERRTALISAAVTGKIDVREWDAPNA
jgi:type I restriction enzyme S subunit